MFFRHDNSRLRWVLFVGACILAVTPVRAQNGVGATTASPQPAGTLVQDYGPTRLNAFAKYIDVDADGGFLLSSALHDPVEETFGATLQPVSESLRAQLGIPAGQGLLVATLRPEGPSAQVGLKVNDIVLTVADQPVSAAADLTKRLKAAGESAVPLKVLRAGKPLTLQVRPAYRVTFASIEESKTEYYLGINIEAVDEALRSQLSLPAGRGVLISEVLVESPAEKAGVKKHDIVIELGGKTMDGVETLMAQVQAEKDKATTLKVLRGGKIVTLPITGAVRKAQGEAAYKDYVMQRLITDGNDNAAALGIQFLDAARLGSRGSNANADGKLLERLDRLEKEVKALREALEAANARKPN